MKLKSLVIAMGLVAATSAMASSDDSGAMGSTSAQAALDKLNKVYSRDVAERDGSDWTKMVEVHGGLYTDGHWGDTDTGYTGENDNRFSVTNAYLNLTATPNEWSRVNIDVNYSDASDKYLPSQADEFFVDQAYATFGNFDKYPLYLQVGQQYTPFGSNYDLYPIITPMTQVLSQANQTGAQVGFIGDKGVYGSVYSFQNQVSKDTSDSEADTNFGAAVGFQKQNDRMTLDLGVSYLSDMAGVDAIQHYLQDYNNGSYLNTVHGASTYANFNTGPFGFGVDYVTAMDNFDKSDIQGKTTATDGAKPWASGVNATYDFMLKKMQSQLMVGYQKSGDSSELGLPESRYLVGYSVSPWKNTTLGLVASRDTAYGDEYLTKHGEVGDGDSTYTYSLRVGVKF